MVSPTATIDMDSVLGNMTAHLLGVGKREQPCPQIESSRCVNDSAPGKLERESWRSAECGKLNSGIAGANPKTMHSRMSSKFILAPYNMVIVRQRVAKYGQLGRTGDIRILFIRKA